MTEICLCDANSCHEITGWARQMWRTLTATTLACFTVVLFFMTQSF